MNKKSGYERESACIAFQSFATVLGPPSAPILIPLLPILYELYMDKGDVVRAAASSATRSILKLCPPESTRIVFRTLEDILEKGKWRSKVGVLDAMRSFVNSAKDFVADQLGETLPKVEMAMHDTKQEVNDLFYSKSILRYQLSRCPPPLSSALPRCARH
jgi:elongation factor 3